MGAPADHEPCTWQLFIQQTIADSELCPTKRFGRAPRHTEALNQGYLNGDEAPPRVGILTKDHFGSTVVCEKTFAADVVSMLGNSGGDGSYLMLIANSTHTPSVQPVLPPTNDPTGKARNLWCAACDLGSMELGGASYTFATCLARCDGHRSMSFQLGGECFCADAYGDASL